MALIKYKPTSPGTRAVVKIDRSHLHKGGPYAPLTAHQNKTGARNHSGRITTRQVGGGSRQKYRIIDFKRDKDGIAGVVERLEYDPNRTSHIALMLVRGWRAPLHPRAQGREAGRRDPLWLGFADQGRQRDGPAPHPDRLDRAQRRDEARQGWPARAQRRQLGVVHGSRRQLRYVRLKSGETRKVHIDCRATIGEVGNDEHNLRSYGKAGAKRWRGIRPTVRGVVDEPGRSPARWW